MSSLTYNEYKETLKSHAADIIQELVNDNIHDVNDSIHQRCAGSPFIHGGDG